MKEERMKQLTFLKIEKKMVEDLLDKQENRDKILKIFTELK